MNRILLAGACAGLMAALGQTATAQTIDYGSLEQLFSEPVTTSAIGAPQRATDAPAPMQIITAEDIKRSGANDIPTILSRLSGLNVLKWGEGGQDVGVRGYNSAYSGRLLVLVNGRQVYLDTFNYTVWGLIPVNINEIRQIEVVEGPNCALFGFNAVSGVVNILTYNPKYDKVDNVQVDQSTAADDDYKGAVTAQILGRLSMRLSGEYGRFSQFDYTNPVVRATALTPYRDSKANLDSVLKINDKTDLRAEFGYAQVLQDEATVGGANGMNYSLANYDLWSGKVDLKSETKFGQIALDGWRNESRRLSSGQFPSTDDVGGVTASDLFKLTPTLTIRFNGEFRNNRINDRMTPNAGHVSYNVFSGSSMANWQISEKWVGTLALRVDDLHLHRHGDLPANWPFTNADWEREITEPSVNASLVFKPTGEDTIRLNLARGVGLPPLNELGQRTAVPTAAQIKAGGIVSSNPFLDPTLVTNYEVDYARKLDPVHSTFGVDVYYQQNKNLLGIPPVAPQTPDVVIGKFDTLDTWRTVGTSELEGAEFNLDGSLNGFRWKANYTLLSIQDHYPSTVNLLTSPEDYSASTPKNTVNLSGGWTNKTWTIDVYDTYYSKLSLPQVGAVVGQPRFQVAGYNTVDARLAYQAPLDITLAVYGQNLTTTRQIETSALPINRRLYFSVSKSW